MSEKEFYKELIKTLIDKKPTKNELSKIKVKLCKKHQIKDIPTDIQIITHASSEEIKKISLVTKPTRTLSGVAPIALMTKPSKCPHGTCIYCPGGLGSEFGDVPQSYTGKEPSTMRSIRNNYNPYLTVFNRLEQFILLNQIPEKTEIIIQGGTFLSLDKKYKDEFIMYSFKALNDFSETFYKNKELDYSKFKKFYELPCDKNDENRTNRLHKKILLLKKSSTLIIEQKRNESSKIRCVGLTIETNPDHGLLKHGNEMLSYGCTRVELGIQATDDKILKYIKRGHNVKDSIESTRILKDLGFKINYHMMLGLPFTDDKKDLKMLKETIKNSDYRPDMYKIYPTLVMKGTPLYSLWKNGKFIPLKRDKAADIISDFKKTIPHWVRVMRIQRDIPTHMTEAGVDKTNLRQYVDKMLIDKDIKCRCIRCREAGLLSLKGNISQENIKLFIEKYGASNGEEFFMSFEDKTREVLFGYCRLRLPSQNLRKEISTDSAIIRELHVVGSAVGIGDEGKIQHKGLGKKLLECAESIAKKNKKNKIVVISGVGVRPYYKKLGYKLEGPYMVKKI